MDIECAVYMRELQVILVCDQSDSYLKKWAKCQLEKIEHHAKLVADAKRTPALVA